MNTAKDQITGAVARSQASALDPLGNWNTLTTNGSAATRTHNKQNQITGTGNVYDANGNMTGIAGTSPAYRYDSWHRMVQFDCIWALRAATQPKE